jgi:RNA ligase
MLLSEMFDKGLLEAHLAHGIVNRQRHPTISTLSIYNYTARAQYDRIWDEVTTACRGLIIHHETGVVLARPFPKFFNLGEHDEMSLPTSGAFDVTDKMDGSLGIAYPTTDGYAIATRGSFASEQALHATEVFRSRYAHIPLNPNATYLFEIIFPENRIVIDYGSLDDLVLLTVIDTETGADLPLPEEWPGPKVGHHRFVDIASVRAFIDTSADSGTKTEGVVVRFHPDVPQQPSLRIKLKLADYVQLHRIITGISTVDVWDAMSEGRSLDEWLEHVPDEFYNWVRATADGLQAQFASIEAACLEVMQAPEAQPGTERRDVAAFFAGHENRAVLFKMFDRKPYASIIWRTIRPEYAKPLLVDTDQ